MEQLETAVLNRALTDSERKAVANLQAFGRDLVTQFYVCLKTAAFYDPTNDNFRKQIGKMQALLQVADEVNAKIRLTSVDGYLFINDQRLKINLEGYLAAKYIIEKMTLINVSGVELDPTATADELNVLALEIVRQNRKIGADELNQVLAQNQVSKIKFIPALALVDEQDLDEEGQRVHAKKSFFKAISVVQEVLTNYTKVQQVALIKAKRAIHSMVDQIIKNESYMLELAALKNHDQYTYKHSVNVSVISVALGLRLGLNKIQLAELGFAALFHDFGKTKIPIDLLNKPQNLSKSDWSQMEEHPTLGAKALAQSFIMDRHTARAMLVAFEHHKNLDGTGYPYINRARQLNLYSRVVAICDFFDALTSGRSYRKNAVPVDEVIIQMIKQSRTKFDPYLLKVLIHIIGVYPIGALLLLDSGELAVVVRTDPEDVFRPEVKVIADQTGKKLSPERVRLAAYDRNNERYFRNVMHMVDPEKYGIDVSRYLLED